MRGNALWAVVLCQLAGSCPSLRADDGVKVRQDVVYGRKDGMALTLDVFTPPKPNGAGVLFIQSGGWYSTWNEPKLMQFVCQPMLDKGITVFIVRHGSAPKYVIPEIVEDVRRSVRFIRFKAKELDVDPERLGVLGASAGGHLTMVLATTGDDGDSKAKDEVLRQSSRIAVAVAICPPTDIRKWVSDPPPLVKANTALMKPLTFDSKLAGDYSPVLHASRKTPPTLLIHGDKDELVPIEHSNNMMAALEKEKVKCKLVVIEGGEHAFTAKHNLSRCKPGSGILQPARRCGIGRSAATSALRPSSSSAWCCSHCNMLLRVNRSQLYLRLPRRGVDSTA